MPFDWRDLFAYLSIGGLVLSGIGGITWFLFRTFSEKWLDARFKERLERLKHDQAQEIEHLKGRINALLDRAVKLNKREYEIVPEAWGLLWQAQIAVGDCINFFQSYPDLRLMPAHRLMALLEQYEFREWERVELEAVDNKQEFFETRVRAKKFSKAAADFNEFTAFVGKKGLFIPPSIHPRFDEARMLLWEALLEHDVHDGKGGRRPEDITHRRAMHSQGKQKLEDLRVEITTRIWVHETKLTDTIQPSPALGLIDRDSGSPNPRE